MVDLLVGGNTGSGSISQQEPVSMLVWNEQTKLLAGAIDRVSTAIAVTGVLPLISAWQSSSHGDILYNLAALYISAFSAVMIHRLARRTLKFLDD